MMTDDDRKYGFIEILLAIVIAIIVLGFVSAIVPQSFTSASPVDLIVNNLVNISLAVFVSLYAVQRYESARHRTEFIIDLISRVDQICDEMINIITIIKIKDIDSDKIEIWTNIDIYCQHVQGLFEYVTALNQQFNKMPKYKKAIIELDKMRTDIKNHSDSLSHTAKINPDEIDQHNHCYNIIKSNALMTIFEIKTYVTRILGSVKH